MGLPPGSDDHPLSSLAMRRKGQGIAHPSVINGRYSEKYSWSLGSLKALPHPEIDSSPVHWPGGKQREDCRQQREHFRAGRIQAYGKLFYQEKPGPQTDLGSVGLIQSRAHRNPGGHLCQISQRLRSQAEEGAEVSKEEWPLPEPMDISSQAQHQQGHLDHVTQSGRIWRPDTHVTPLHLSADIEPEHFVMALLA